MRACVPSTGAARRAGAASDLTNRPASTSGSRINPRNVLHSKTTRTDPEQLFVVSDSPVTTSTHAP